MSPEFWIQLPGWLAAGLVVASFQSPNLVRLIWLQGTGYVLLTLQFYLLHAWTGAVMAVIGIARLVVAYVAIRHPGVKRYYPAFFPVIWGACLLTATGWESVLPAIGYTLGTLAVIQGRMMRTRVLYLTAHPFWLVYDVIVGAYGATFMEALNIASSSTAILRYKRRMHPG